MIFCIVESGEILKAPFKCECQGYMIYTHQEVDSTELLLYLNSYGVFFHKKTIQFTANELNSNFIYYDRSNKISNSLSFYDAKIDGIDNTGVIQRLTGPDFCNFGSRTIYRGVKKSLPSTNYVFENKQVLITDTNKRLKYSNKKLNFDLVEEIQKTIIAFHSEIVSKYRKVHMAMSGGLDSRLSWYALNVAASNHHSSHDPVAETCMITYGDPASLDVKISKRIASLFKIPIQNFYDVSLVWPTEGEYEQYFINSNGVGISNWNMIGSQSDFGHDECIVLGDLYEIIVGRKLEMGLNRKEKLSLFKSEKRRKEFYKNPKKNIFQDIVRSIQKSDYMKSYFIEEKSKNFSWNMVLSESKEDIEECFRTINDDLLPEQILEYFTMICYTNPEYRNQIHTIRSFANAHSISENLDMINLIVSIDPSFRRDGRLLGQLFKKSEEWKKLLRFPQASAPYLPSSFSSKSIINSQKLIRHFKEYIFLRLENNYPKHFTSRWSFWRRAYMYAKYRPLRGKFGIPIENYIDSKSELNKSLPIPNFSIVNFESIMIKLNI